MHRRRTGTSCGGAGRGPECRRSYKLHTAAELVEDRGRRSGSNGGSLRRRTVALVEDRGQRTSREPAAGVMDRRPGGQSLDSESTAGVYTWNL